MAILSVSACSGYFSQQAVSGDQSQLLAIAGGGSLSLPGSDEITPYLFRNTNGANPILFFASDRGGDFDIYYAAMNSEGVFSQPQPLGPDINTTNHEKNPMITWIYNGELQTFDLFLLFTRESNGFSYLVTSTLQDDVSFQIDFQGYYDISLLSNGFSGISMEVNPYNMYINISYGTNYYVSYWFDGFSIDWYYPATNTNALVQKIYDTSTYYNDTFYPFVNRIILYSQGGNDHNQLYLYGDVQDFTFQVPVVENSYARIPDAFRSSSDDRDPFIDWQDPARQGKIYFSSDRETDGDYDLYRYNVNTINELIQFYPFDQYYSNKLIGTIPQE